MALWRFVLVLSLTTTALLGIDSKPTARPSKGMEGRVMGGALSRQNQFPYLISIGDYKSGNHMCGGSLIKKNLVLTAAHCFLTHGTKTMMKGIVHIFTGGEHDLKRHDGTEQESEASKIVFHKDYEPKDNLNDIALVELKKPFRLTEAVKTISMATSKSKYHDTNCTVSGWGNTGQGLSDTPQFVHQDIIKKDTCVKLYVPASAAHESEICAGKLAGGQGSCNGDSGGPLTCQAVPSDEPLLVGMVSGAAGCALPNSPTMYTNVRFMESWIQKAEAKLATSKEHTIWV